jgi:hypothetical protein
MGFKRGLPRNSRFASWSETHALLTLPKAVATRAFLSALGSLRIRSERQSNGKLPVAGQ